MRSIRSTNGFAEIKILRAKDRNRLETVKAEGLEQLARYGENERMKYGFRGERVKKVLLVVVGKNEVFYFPAHI